METSRRMDHVWNVLEAMLNVLYALFHIISTRSFFYYPRGAEKMCLDPGYLLVSNGGTM